MEISYGEIHFNFSFSNFSGFQIHVEDALMYNIYAGNYKKSRREWSYNIAYDVRTT